MRRLRIALLHLAPRVGDLEYNRQMVETALTTAAGFGAAWIVTPELWLCGYQFSPCIGTAWIASQPDAWMRRLCQMAARLRVTVFLSYPEQDRYTAKLYNTVFVIAANGTIVGTHRKIHIVPIAEGWSSPGDRVVPVRVDGVNVGILICADAYTPPLARRLQEQGAQLLVSSAAWGPWPHGPNGAWEQRTRETGLPLFVCNRTGEDQTLSFMDAESVVIKDGQRLVSFQASRSAIVLVDWALATQELIGKEAQIVYL